MGTTLRNTHGLQSDSPTQDGFQEKEIELPESLITEGDTSEELELLPEDSHSI